MWKCFKIICVCYLQIRTNLLKEHRSKLSISGPVQIMLKFCTIFSFVLSYVCCCHPLNASNMWPPSSSILQASILKQGSQLTSLQRDRVVPHGVNEQSRFHWLFLLKEEVHRVLHKKKLVQILWHFCSCPGYSMAAVHRESMGDCTLKRMISSPKYFSVTSSLKS